VFRSGGSHVDLLGVTESPKNTRISMLTGLLSAMFEHLAGVESMSFARLGARVSQVAGPLPKSVF
jgi:hypothetical protein